MYPHERSLVKRSEGKPFALVGINSDPKSTLQKTIEKEKMTWRSFWDGGTTQGPIATKWNVSGWPTLYVLDAKGVIRHKWMGSPGDEVLDKAIEKLIAEAEGGKKPEPDANKKAEPDDGKKKEPADSKKETR
jgi:peroxiredoxin